MTPCSPLAALLVSLATAWATAAHAGPGHDHGDAAPAPSGPALPRFTATSETFELVGVLNGRQLTLYLDRAADNAPVAGAQIALEIAGVQHQAQAQDDTYGVTLAEPPKPGVLPVTATVTTGAELDLLAGELDLQEDAHADGAAHSHAWPAPAGWAAAGLAALAALIAIGRRLAARRQRPTGAAA
ncbi:hypothetical protein [Pseudaquabacterium pictum]|uniref:hypothetical protein n=1 Tax=Pseudaquabacterium pictum TaxID=2315236 RepID=UPI0010FA086F|nr:hypothetical protein [Rubrivivax pictus]